MFSFSNYALKGDAFSTLPFQILGPEEKSLFSLLMEIILLETGDRAARERWQAAQLTNLLAHAAKRSRFWNERLGGKKPSNIKLSRLPILARDALNQQVQKEGALVSKSDGVATHVHATSGSTGVPVKFHVSQANVIYNEIRYFAQHILEARDLRLNRLRLKPKFPLVDPGFMFHQADSYAGKLSKIFKTGLNGSIEYANPDIGKLLEKLKKFQSGYLICQPHLVEIILDHGGLESFQEMGVKTWIPIGASVPDWVAQKFAEASIPVRSNYSCEEMGLIASECESHPGFYHVATSNVIVEVSSDKIDYRGIGCGRIVVTHLHNYATPFIRYDLGDLGNLNDKCPCGHDGPTLTDLFGRVKTSLKHKDGRRSPFHIRGPELNAVVAFQEYRIRQTELDKLVLEIATPHQSAAAAEQLKAYLRGLAGDDFGVEVVFLDQIDWGQSVKRLAFQSDV